MNKRIYLSLAHMSGREQDFIKEAFDTNWVVPLGPNVNAFEKELADYLKEGRHVSHCLPVQLLFTWALSN